MESGVIGNERGGAYDVFDNRVPAIFDLQDIGIVDLWLDEFFFQSHPSQRKEAIDLSNCFGKSIDVRGLLCNVEAELFKEFRLECFGSFFGA